MATTWRQLARSFEYVETLQRPLLDRERDALPPTGRRYHVSENSLGAADWYWELMDADGAIIARGLADTHDGAFVRAQAAELELDRRRPAEGASERDRS